MSKTQRYAGFSRSRTTGTPLRPLDWVNRQCLTVAYAGVLILSVIFSELVFAQGELDIVSTDIERRSNNRLDSKETELVDGSHWQLDANEWERAESLKSAFRQYVSDRRISPLEVLGIHARTDTERARYARRWAQLMIQDAERVLAFQRAYDAAVRDLLKDQPLVDLSQLPSRTFTIPTFLPSDRFAVFVGLECTLCDEVLKRVFRAGREVAGVDIYVMDIPEGEELTLHNWARRQGIPPMEVHSKRITLNFDAGLLESVHPRAQNAPVVMRRRGDRLEPVDPWKLP